MFEQMKIKSQIKKLTKELETVEQKRVRSQAALVEAIITRSTPDDNDVDYFNRYTARINELRDQIHELQQKLK